MMPDRPKNTVLIVVKSPYSCDHVYTKPDQTIFGLRALIGAKFEIKLDVIVLVFAGKILSDNGTMVENNIVEGSVVHLVQRKITPDNGTKSAETAPLALRRKSMQCSGTPNTVMVRVNCVKTLIQALCPQMDSALNEPGMLREILLNDPRMKHVMDRHPSIRHHINNDAYVREMIQCMMCPARMEELNRKRDMMLLRVENTPGGTAILNSLNNSMVESLDYRPAHHASPLKKQRTTNSQLGKENNMPLPNPWTRPRKVRRQVPRFIRRLSRLSRNLSVRNQINKSTQTDRKAEKDGGSKRKSSSSKRLVPIIIRPNQQTDPNQKVVKILRCIANVVSDLLEKIQIKTGGTETKKTSEPPRPLEESEKQIVAEFVRVLQDAKVSSEEFGIQTSNEISIGYEETIQVVKATGEKVFVTKRSQGTNTISRHGLASTFRIISAATNPKNVNLLSEPTEKQQQKPVLPRAISCFSGDYGASGNSNNGAENNELPPEIRYREQLEHLASLGFNNRNENLVALVQSLGDVNAAAALLLQIKKD